MTQDSQLTPFVVAMLPGMVLHFVGLIFAAIGWNRHRVVAFVLFLASEALFLAGNVFVLIAHSQSANFSGGVMSIVQGGTRLGYLGGIFGVAGLGCFAFCNRFVSPHEPPKLP